MAIIDICTTTTTLTVSQHPVVLSVRIFFDNAQSQEYKSNFCAQKFEVAMRIKADLC